MKKTISIHLVGSNFLVEEDAYELVKNYLDRLNESLKNSPDKKEICEDVELRIAELATAYLTEKKQVITFEEMSTIIATLGQPEDFLEDEIPSDNDKEEKTAEKIFSKKERRLFRDTENSVIAGVCSGLAAYFNIDTVVLRIIFILLGFAGGFIVPFYIIMWFIVPSAKTNIDRLQMQGKPINLENLKDEFQEATNRFSKSSKKFEREISDKDSPLRQKITHISSIFTKIIGAAFLIFGSLLLIGLLTFTFVDWEVLHIEKNGFQLNFNQFCELFIVNETSAFYLWIGILISGLGVVSLLLLQGAKLIFQLQSKWIKIVKVVLFIVTFSGIGIIFLEGSKTGADFTNRGEFEQIFGPDTTNVLTVEIVDRNLTNNIHNDDDFDFEGFQILENKIIQSGISIDYSLSEDSLFHVYVEYSAFGKTNSIANQRSKNIKHTISLENHNLKISPNYSYSVKDKIRGQTVMLKISIPAGKSVQFRNTIVHSEDIKDSGFINRYGDYEHFEHED
jgi:phage shock protein PspC (stress-responsive transcriptional regulator)